MQNIEKRYPNMCKGYFDVKQNRSKNLPFDPEVKEFQMIYNKMYPTRKVIVDGIVGPQMRELFCTPA
jgi:hypothetical protein